MFSRSDYFATHRDTSTRFQASDPYHIYLPDRNPILIEKMIQFIYTSDYSTSTVETSISVYKAEPKPLAVYASIYRFGDFYGIRSLKCVAAGRFKKLIEPCSPAWKAFRSPELLASIYAIKIVYTTTPDKDGVLRDSMTPCLPRNLHDMFWFKKLRELANGVPELVEKAFDEGMFGK